MLSPRRTANLAIAISLVLSVSACALPVHRRTLQAPSAVPAINLSAARKVLTAYQVGRNSAEAKRSVTVLRDYERGSALAIHEARMRIELRLHPGKKTARIEFVSPIFYIPRLSTYPHWFVVQTSLSGDKDKKVVFLVFEKSSVVDDAWKLALAPTGTKDASLPGVAVDHDGYAMTTSTRSALAISPRKLPAAHAELITRGTTAPETSRFAVDSFTTQLRKRDSDESSRLRNLATVSHSYVPEAQTTSYALQAKHGGALVFYVLQDTSVFQSSTSASAPATSLSPDESVVALTTSPDFVTQARLTQLDEFAAYIPRSGKALVLGHEGGLTAAVLT